MSLSKRTALQSSDYCQVIKTPWESLETLFPGLEQGVELQAYPRSPKELLTRTHKNSTSFL